MIFSFPTADRSPATSTYRKKKASFYGLEARGDHYAKRVMQWCRAIGCFVDFWVDHWCADATGYGGYQTATPPPYYTTANATTRCYTEVAQLGLQLHHQGSRYTTTCAAPSYYTEDQKFYSSPGYTTKSHVHNPKARKY
ncbi:hypothetical protein DAPPUDRAFT_260152 [Daphnia pulex]|uniref:Uncharacterized protein n=1 Tax=Daphnia pulex TaxID=6669 RepID=E9HIL6_DAPPU|nr:hypothetical protein DAPPUDRAFT_260152 [Daphnia pulex]|eukprot:EFX68421.1 hypothetical protein DAPPUDRAFT_260152 [Daphnia pulex]